jgi:tRNA-intron endonuclease
VEFRLEDGVVKSLSRNISWFRDRGYGEVGPDGHLTLSPVEALYLLRAGRITVSTSEGRILGFEELLNIQSSRLPNLWRDYVIYMDLRDRRYVVKEGFSPHLRFRVFERGTYPEAAAKYVIIPVYEGDDMAVEDLLEHIRACRAMNKTPVVAVVDRRNEIVYYTVSIVNLVNL